MAGTEINDCILEGCLYLLPPKHSLVAGTPLHKLAQFQAANCIILFKANLRESTELIFLYHLHISSVPAGNLDSVQALAATVNCLSQLASDYYKHPGDPGKVREVFNKAMLTRQAASRQSKKCSEADNLLHLHLLALTASVSPFWPHCTY